VGGSEQQVFANRRHFFAAAAEAMRRILVESARQKATRKRGSERGRGNLDPDAWPVAPPGDPLEVLAIHDLLDLLAAESPRKAEVVKLRYFLGCTVTEATEVRRVGGQARWAGRVNPLREGKTGQGTRVGAGRNHRPPASDISRWNLEKNGVASQGSEVMKWCQLVSLPRMESHPGTWPGRHPGDGMA
jgi:hypothetical protein